MIFSTVALVGVSMAGVTFDATDYSPDYMTGIVQVYAEAENGTEIYIPVYSLPECEDEDGTGDPCVWVAGKNGNREGQSYIQLGTEDNRIFADVSPWAAEILVERGTDESERRGDYETADSVKSDAETLEDLREYVREAVKASRR